MAEKLTKRDEDWAESERKRYAIVDGLVARGSCRCIECGRGVSHHSIKICRGCERKLTIELHRMGWGDWLNGGPAPSRLALEKTDDR